MLLLGLLLSALAGPRAGDIPANPEHPDAHHLHVHGWSHVTVHLACPEDGPPRVSPCEERDDHHHSCHDHAHGPCCPVFATPTRAQDRPDFTGPAFVLAAWDRGALAPDVRWRGPPDFEWNESDAVRRLTALRSTRLII